MINNKHIAIVAVILLLLIFFNGNPRPKVEALKDDSVILAFGDSLTYGTGASQTENYPTYLQQILGIKVVASGIPGELSQRGLSRLPEVLKEVKPDLTILCHGGNDILQNSSLDKLKQNLNQMIRMIKASGSDVILIGVPQKNLMLSPPGLYQELADEHKLPYLDDLISGIMVKRTLKSDSVHPNAAGYKVIAEKLAKLINEIQR